MARARSRRLRLLESLRRTLSEKLHLQVWRAARQCGRHAPENTAAIYAMAKAATPDLLDQLLLVHHRVIEEEHSELAQSSVPPIDDIERKRMLSAVRATVDRASTRLGEMPPATP
jgi:nucleotidyltransferase/DNA polymerase involved in DNA repair